MITLCNRRYKSSSRQKLACNCRTIPFVFFLFLLACASPSEPSSEFRLNFRGSDSEGFAKVDKVRQFDFPRDHGPHEQFRNEWWYLTSILRTSDDRVFGSQFTLFRQALTSEVTSSNQWQTGQLYLAHFAVSDVESKRHHSFERMARGHRRIAGVQTQPFRLHMDDWMLKSKGEEFASLELLVKERDYEVHLELELTKPIVLHEDQGLSRKGPENYTYYYSIPRLRTVGTIRTPEGTFSVQGSSWLDREWMSALLSEHHLGWIWFSLQLYDGRDVVLFRLRSKTPEMQEHGVGLVVESDGTKKQLKSSEWSAEPLRHWDVWPVAWHLMLEGRNYVIEPPFDDQLMRTNIQYWEGVVFVKEGKQLVGEGYLELTGF